MTKQTADLSSAVALAARARQHFDEFRACIGGDALWRIDEADYSATREWGYTLRLNRALLKKIERVVADCAIDLMSALDHMAAALARANGHRRITTLYYPFGTTENDYQAALKRHQAALTGYENLLASAHSNFAAYVPHVGAAKELSNTSKHWSLLAPLQLLMQSLGRYPGLGRRFRTSQQTILPPATLSSSIEGQKD
jgi:hypothetical protein